MGDLLRVGRIIGRELKSVAPIGILLAIAISAGAYLQYGLVSTVNRPFVQDISSDSSYLVIPSIGEWAKNIVFPESVLVGFLAVFFAKRQRRSISRFMTVLLLSLISMQTVTDFFGLVYIDALSINAMATNILANTIGFGLLTLIVVGLVAFLEKIESTTTWDHPYSLEVVVFTFSGLLISLAIFLACFLFFSVTSVALEMTFRPKVSAWILGPEEDKTFDFGKVAASPNKYDLTIGKGKGSLTLRSLSTTPVRVRLHVARNCIDNEKISKLLKSTDVPETRVRSLSISSDKMFSFVGEASSVSMTTSNDAIGMMWVDLAKKPRSASMFSSDWSVERSESGKAVHVARVGTVKNVGRKLASDPATMALRIQGKNLNIKFVRPTNRGSATLECTLLPLDSTKPEQIVRDATIGGVVLELDEDKSENLSLGYDRRLNIVSDSG